MQFHYQEHSRKAGIYKIVNTHTGRVYIGQAREFKERWRGHSYSLLRSKHQNRFLQADFNKCREELGHDDFLEFHVVEVMENSTKEERNTREEELLTQWFDGGKQCYNLTDRAVSREGCPSKDPEETFRKLREINRKRMEDPAAREKMRLLHLGKPKSPEAIEKMREAKCGKVFTDEHKAKLSAAKLGRKQTPEHIENAARTRRGRKHGPLSEETKQKLSLAAKQRWAERKESTNGC